MRRIRPVCLALLLVWLGFGLLVAGARPAQADERVLADEWTAEFEGGVKVSWAHQRITEGERVDGQRRFFAVNRGWTPVGETLIVEEEHVETDSTGRLLRYRAHTTGPRGTYRVTVDEEAWRVSIRALPAVEGQLDKEVYDLGIVLALMRRGLLPPGRRTLDVLDLPGQGRTTRTFQMRPRDDGRWVLEQGDQVLVRSADGDLVESADKDRPRWSRRRTTEEAAPDCSLRDETWAHAAGAAGGSAPTGFVEGPTVRVKAPPAPWVLRRQQDAFGTLIGAQHPLQTIVVAMEFDVAMGVTEAERLALATQIQAALNQQPTLPQLGTPEAASFREHDAVSFPLGGTINQEPVAGEAHLYRSQLGQAVLVMGFYPKDMALRCAPLAESGLRYVHLDAVSRRTVPWRRVKPSGGGLTLEVPGGWLRKGMADKWVSTGRMSSISVNRGTLPPAIDVATAQKLWVSKLHQRPNLREVQTLEAGEITLDGQTLYRTAVRARVVRPGQADLPMTAVSVALPRAAQGYVEVIVMAFDVDWEATEIARVLESVRFEEEALAPSGR